MTLPTPEQSAYLTTLEDTTIILQKAQINIKKCPKQRLTEGYIKTRIKTIDDYWYAYKQAHTGLAKCTPREQRGEMAYFLNEEYFKFEEMYLCLQADLKDFLSKLETEHKPAGALDTTMSSTSSQNNQSPFAALPKIKLPTFSGRYEDWPTYQDLFTALVHNNSTLSNVQKLHYLKTSVAGEAEILLRHIHTTDSNYTAAWEVLRGRFGNKKMIVNSLLKRMFGQKKMNNQSATQIKSLLDTTKECTNSLNNLGINTDSWSPMIIFLVAQKLDTESLKHWEETAHKDNSDELSTWEELQRFLESKFRTLELVAPTSTTSRDKTQTPKTFHATAIEQEDETFQTAHASVTEKTTCVYCNGDHYLYNCKDFAKQTIEQRQQFVRNKNLCYNCLIPNHSVYRCRQRTSCRICHKRHHSLLHRTRETSEITQQPEVQPEQTITTAHFSKEQPGQKVLLATAQVEVNSRDGNTYTLRALIDQGSEASFVSARAVELLGLPRTDISGVASGVGEGNQIPLKHLVEMKVKSRYNTNEAVRVNA